MIDLASGQQEAAQAIVFEIGRLIIAQRLAIFWFFPSALDVAQHAIGVQGDGNHGIPGFGDEGHVLLFFQVALADAPGDAIGEK